MSNRQYVARKSVADIVASGDAGQHSLNKTLGVFSITALGVGVIIGAGIFVLTGTAAAKCAVPGVMLSSILAGLACALVGLCYAELAAARLNNLMVLVKLVVVVAFIGFGVSALNAGHWMPFVPDNTGTFGEFGLSGVLRASSVVFFAFIGFDAVSTAAQEARNPQRDMPRGILGSLLICTLLYVAVAAVLTGLVPYQELNVPDPMALGIDVIQMPWLSLLVKFGALAGLTTVILVLLYGQSRIFFSMSRDGLLPPMFSRVHRATGTPYLSQISIGVVVAAIAGLFPIHVLGEMVSIGTLFAFVLVCIAVLYVRRTEADAPRPFRVPGVPFVPFIGIGFCVLLMAALPLDTWVRLLVWLAIGVAIYFGYGQHHSVHARGAGPVR